MAPGSKSMRLVRATKRNASVSPVASACLNSRDLTSGWRTARHAVLSLRWRAAGCRSAANGLTVSCVISGCGPRALRIEQPVEMDDEVAHVGVVHGGLRLGLPGCFGALVIRKYADDVEFVEIAELGVRKFRQLAAEHEMQQLFLGAGAGHVVPVRLSGS